MCGIAGAFGVKNAAYVVSLMLKALQHRGQEGAGIAAADGSDFRLVRGFGLVDEVFGQTRWEEELPGNRAIGHVRYPTSAGAKDPRCIQPFHCQTRHGNIAIAHNGTLTNYADLRQKVAANGAIFGSDSDSAIFLHLLANSARQTPWGRLANAMVRAEGAVTMLMLDESGIHGTVDPFGFRPLVWAHWDGGILFASETTAFDIFPADSFTSADPGTVISATDDGVKTRVYSRSKFHRHCSFSHVYFCRPDSHVFHQPSYSVRVRLGQALAKRGAVEADVVVPVPDSSNVMALAYSQASGIPFAFGLMRSHYMGRTFITPQQHARELGVRMKLNAVREAVNGNRVVVVDDSIVRGTTSKKIVKLLRDAGASEVHFRVASPPVGYPCFWGINTPRRKDLLAAKVDQEDIANVLGADSVTYLEVEDLLEAMGDTDGSQYCVSCFTGQHPTDGLPSPTTMIEDIDPSQ
jgi:amidophosphoribosyltransferase